MIDLENHTNGHAHASEPTQPSNPWASRITPIEPAWCTTPPPRRTWLLRDRRTGEGVLPQGKVGQLVAEGGGGKTMALVQLAVAVATGTPWLGTLDVANPGKVLAILGEEDREEVQRRVYNAVRSTRAPTPDPGAFVTMPLAGVPSEMIVRDEYGNPTDSPFLLWLRSYLAETDGWKLIIVDPLSRFAGLDAEKDNAQATRFIEAVESISVQTGASSLIAHHSNQSSRGTGSRMSATSSRGVTALVDGVRWAATMFVEQVEGLEADVHERLGETVTVAFAKSNYSRRGDPIVLRRDLEHGGALVPLDDADREMIAAARESADPSSRRATEREQRQARIEEARAKREQATIDRRAAEDAALVGILRERPGIGTVELRAAMAGRLGKCGHDAVAAALERLGSKLVREPGPRNGQRHRLMEVQS